MASKDLVKGYCKESKCEYDVYTKEKMDELLGDIYSSSSTYKVGDLVIYNNSLYKCNTDITTAEEWNASHWTLSTLSKELKSIGKPTVLWTGKYNFSTDYNDKITLSSSIRNFDCIEVITDVFGSKRFYNNKEAEVTGTFGGMIEDSTYTGGGDSSASEQTIIIEETKISISVTSFRAIKKRFIKYFIEGTETSPTITFISENQLPSQNPANVVKIVGYRFN